MIAFIKGVLIQANPIYATVEAGGLGYKVFLPAGGFSKLPQEGESIFLHTSFIVREQSQTLYGFFSAGERELFEGLISVSGVGPKLALALIGHLELHELQRAISQADSHTLSKVPGVGKRTAERLIVELRDKLPAMFPRDLSGNIGESGSSSLIKDALSALINLGYTQAMAKKAIQDSLKELPDDTQLPDLITSALKNI